MGDSDWGDRDASPHEQRSFGRRRGRALSPRQQMLVEQSLPRLSVPSGSGRLDLAALGFEFPANDIWLEIGFGGGEHLLWQARHHPGAGLIGCEPFLDGIVKVVDSVQREAIGNIRLHADDVRPLLRRLPPASLGRVFVLFPDPWPKKKHQKRRLVAGPLLDLLARVMKPGAELRLATDIPDYVRSMLVALLPHPAFAWPATRPKDWQQRPADWPETRYEQKAKREGRRAVYLTFRRR